MLADALGQLESDLQSLPVPIQHAVRDGTVLAAIVLVLTPPNMLYWEYAWPVAPAQLFLFVAICNVIWAGEKWAKRQEDSDHRG